MTFKTTQLGVGLIEVMVALLLLSVAVLGYSALQGQAIKATNESFERSQSLVIMRTIGEKIRANPNAIGTYETLLKQPSATVPTNKCGLDGQAITTLCTSTELATAESYNITTELSNYDFKVQMHPCPNTGGTSASAATSIMYSYCLISAWGTTTPTIGTDSEKDCLSKRILKEDDSVLQAGGNYYPKSTCMMMEI